MSSAVRVETDRRMAVLGSFEAVVERLGEAPSRVGLLGGSFDPVHKGHVQLASNAMGALSLDCVVVVPARQNPLKKASPVAGQQRLDMLVAAVRDMDCSRPVFVCTWEVQREQPSFTVDTLREARRAMGADCELFWLSGADALPTLHRWRDIHDILTLAHFSVMSRGEPLTDTGVRAALAVEQFSEAEVKGLCQHTLPDRLVDVSSTAVRAAVARGRSIADLVPPSVAAYIHTHNLYSKL